MWEKRLIDDGHQGSATRPGGLWRSRFAPLAAKHRVIRYSGRRQVLLSSPPLLAPNGYRHVAASTHFYNARTPKDANPPAR